MTVEAGANTPSAKAPKGWNRIGAWIMAAILALYIVLAGWRAVQLMTSGEPFGVALGVALLVIPIVGAWALVTEVRFGVRLERLVERLDAAGGMPEPLPTAASGRPDRDAADNAFPAAKAAVEAAPESWQAWLRLSFAYDAARDRRRARHAAREAIRLERAGRANHETKERP